MRRRVLGVAAALIVLGPVAVRAEGLVGSAMTAGVTDVASSFDGPNKFDFRFRVRYDHTETRAQLKREIIVPGQDSLGIYKDLVYSQSRNTVSLRTEFGLWHDLMLSLEMPIVIDEIATYEFDQSAGGSCVFPRSDGSMGPTPTCVNATNSSALADGLAPVGGYDANNPQAGLPNNLLFRSVTRGARGGSGLDAFDTLNLGLTWGALSQARDKSKPNWTVGFEAQISIGNIKAFDRMNPTANHAVSEGTHRFVFRTSLSRRFKFFEPYWNLWYMLPVARNDSQYVDYGAAQKTKLPQMQAGSTFGTEIVPYENKERFYRIALDLRGRVEGHFTGRGYSEIWELLASSPAMFCDPVHNLSCDPAQMSKYSGKPFTGLTTIENYATIGADVAVAAQIGPYFRLRTGFEYSHAQSHFITGDDIGTPASNNPTGRVMAPSEFNPAYRAITDLVGRRYLADNINVYNFHISAQVMF